MRAHALVPVGSDGLSYAFNNNPTNYVGDYSWTANDLLGGGSSAAPEAQGFSRNFDTSLTTQKTLAATAGASTTNSDNAASAGSGAGAYGSNGSSTSYGSSGTTSYGTGSGGGFATYGTSGTAQSAPGEDGLHTLDVHHRPDKDAGLMYIQPTGKIVQGGDAAASRSLGQTNQMADAAGFPHCDGNSCGGVDDILTPDGQPDNKDDGLLRDGTPVRTAAGGDAHGMPKVLDDAVDEARDKEMEARYDTIGRIDIERNRIAEAEKQDELNGHFTKRRQRDAQREALLRARESESNIINDLHRERGQYPNQAITSLGVSTTPDNYGNTYANASQEPWVQNGQYYCYAVAIGSGAIIVVWVAAPAAIAGGKAVASGASFAYAQPILAANLAGAYLARNPGVLQEGLEGGTAFVMAYSETGSVVDATASAGISLLPSAPVTVYQVKALSKAQGVNYTGFKVKICVESQGAGEVAPDSGLSRTIYRSMTEGSDGLPKTGPTARQLGVRPHDDIPVTGGNVSPMTGGMSVAPDTPGNLPSHRRPPSLGGTGKDPVWEFDLNNLGDGVRFRQDSQTHGLLEPGSVMSIDEFQKALAELAKYWSKR